MTIYFPLPQFLYYFQYFVVQSLCKVVQSLGQSLPKHFFQIMGTVSLKVFLVFSCFFSASPVSMNHRVFPSLLGFSSNPDLVPDCLLFCFVCLVCFFKMVEGI